MPQLLAISGTLDIEAAQAEGQLPRFRMIAATGQPMRLEGWRQPVVVDFAGLNVPSQSLPIRYNHDAAQGVGHTDRIAIEGSNLVAEGVVSRDTEAARDVVSSSKRGFPWQASIGASVDKSEFVKEGSQVMVNGRMVAGPVYVVIKSTLAEISFVDRGADQGTSAVAAKGQSMSTVVETEVETDPALIERARAREIKAIFQGEFPQIEAEEIEAGSSVDEARAAYVTALRTSRRRGGGVVVPGRLSGVTAMETLEAAILVRTGREKLAVDTLGPQAVEAARHMRAASLPDICAHALRADHRDPSGMSKSEIIQASLSTLSLPTLFSNVMGKTLLESYRQATATWRDFASVQSAANFLPQVGIRPSFVGELEYLPPAGEIEHGTLAESTFPWRVGTYAKMFSLDRTDLVNDNIGFFDQTPVLLAKAAAQSINNVIWQTIMTNSVGEDGTAFFNTTTHHNLITNAMGSTGLSVAVTAMRSQRDADHNDIYITPQVLAVPPELEATSRSLLTSEYLTQFVEAEPTPTGNPWRTLFDLSVESRLSNTDKYPTLASHTQWFLFGKPIDAPIIVGFLDGREGPVIETLGMDAVPNRLSISFRCYFDFGAALGDWRAAVKSSGTG